MTSKLVCGRDESASPHGPECYEINGDTDAMDAIAAVMGGEWSPDTLDSIATIVTGSGREIADVDDEEEDAATERAIDYLTNPEDAPITRVQVPVSFWVHVREGMFGGKLEVTKLELSPLEGDAGYFGNGSFVFDGPEIDLGDDGDFWYAVRVHLNDHGRKEGHAGNYVEVEWSE